MKTLHTITAFENYRPQVDGAWYSTCRRGRKWTDVELGEEIELTLGSSDAERVPIGRGVVQRIDYLPFEWLAFSTHIKSNHSRNSSVSHEALLAAMRRAYGESFSESEPVTVLFYKRIA